MSSKIVYRGQGEGEGEGEGRTEGGGKGWGTGEGEGRGGGNSQPLGERVIYKFLEMTNRRLACGLAGRLAGWLVGEQRETVGI